MTYFRSSAHFSLPPTGSYISQWLGIALLLLSAISSFSYFLTKDLFGFAVQAGVLCAANVGLSTHRPSTSRAYAFAISFLFVGYGALVLLLSFLRLMPPEVGLPVRGEFILRHSYFLLLWIPFIGGSLAIWNSLASDIIGLCQRRGAIILVFLATSDLITSYFLGNDRDAQWPGYYSFLDKLVFQYWFSFIYLIYCIYSGRWLLSSLLIIVYMILTKVLAIGVMFNSMTGLLLFLVLLIASLPVNTSVKGKILLAMCVGLWANIIIALVDPYLFSPDDNSFWRAMAWKANIASLWDSDLVGRGFGTPYHPITVDNIENAQKNMCSECSEGLYLEDPITAQYIRGQHSSIINIFYRMGIVGGIIFCVFNAVIILFLVKARGRFGIYDARLKFIALVLILTQLLEASFHVAIETPRFLITYMLSVGFAIYVSDTQSLGKRPIAAALQAQD